MGILPRPDTPLNRVNIDASTGFITLSRWYLIIQVFPSRSRRTLLLVRGLQAALDLPQRARFTVARTANSRTFVKEAWR
jgi:hypothetical protein